MRLGSAVFVLAMIGCGPSGVTRAQAEAQRVGVGYLETVAREAAASAGVSYLGCDHAAARTTGSGEHYSVEACGSRVAVSCSWAAGGGPTCNPDPEIEAAARARQERDAARAPAAPRAPVEAPAPTRTAPRSLAEGAAFRLGDDGALALDAVGGYVELRARASAEHAESVLVSVTLVGEDSTSCDHALTITAAGEPLRFDAAQREGPTTHYVLPAAMFRTLGDRVPIRVTVCGQSLPFGHPALRALRAFIAADGSLAR